MWTRPQDPTAQFAAVRRLCDHYLGAAAAAAAWLPSTSDRPGGPGAWVDAARLTVPAPVFATRSAAVRWCEQETPALAGIAELARQHERDAADQLPLVLAGVLAMRAPQLWLQLHQIAHHRSSARRDPAVTAYLALGLGAACRANRWLKEAVGHLEAAAVAFNTLAEVSGRARALAEIGRCYADRASVGRAGRHFTDAAELFAQCGDVVGAADMQVELADIDREIGDHDAAESRFHRAHTTLADQDATACAARCRRRWAALHRDRDQPGLAAQSLRAAAQAAGAAGDLAEHALCLRDLAHLHAATGTPSDAAQHYRAAAEAFDQLLDTHAADEMRTHATAAELAGAGRTDPSTGPTSAPARVTAGTDPLTNHSPPLTNYATLPPQSENPHREGHDDVSGAAPDTPAGDPAAGDSVPAPWPVWQDRPASARPRRGSQAPPRHASAEGHDDGA